MNKYTYACVIPTIGREDLFKLCLNSLLKQIKRFDEIIVVSDNNDFYDDRLECEFITQVLYTGGGKGGPFARQLGFVNSKCDYVFFLDDDDCVDERCLLELDRSLSVSEMVPGFCSTKIIKVWSEGYIPRQAAPPPAKIKEGFCFLDSAQVRTWVPSTSSGFVVSKKYYSDLPINTSIQGFNDVQLWNGVIGGDVPIMYCPEAVTYFMQYFSKKRMTSSVSDRILKIEEANRNGMRIERELKNKIIFGVLLSNMRNESFNRGWRGLFFSLKALKSGVRNHNVRVRYKPFFLSFLASVWLCFSRHFKLWG